MNKGKAEKTEDKENAKQKDKLIDNLNQFKETRWFPLVVALVIIGAGIIVAFLLGLRITYAPELENSWDAISAVASWASVAASFLLFGLLFRSQRKSQKSKMQLLCLTRDMNFTLNCINGTIWRKKL